MTGKTVDPKVTQRFWAKVYYGRECWTWKGAMNRRLGYGFFWMDGKNIGAHRAAWMITKGPIPPHAEVMHTCDNPGCVRPEHLRLGSHAANMQDMVNKGRGTPRKTPEERALSAILKAG